MAFPQYVLDDIARGKSYLSDRNVESIADIKSGCGSCGTNPGKLKQVLRALDYKVELNEYDSIAVGLYKCMMLTIGRYVPDISPKVSAGVDQIIQFPASTIFTAIQTPGSAPIVSILWTQLLGANNATLTNANTATVTVTNTVVGNYMFKVEVTDSNGLKGFDIVILSVVALIGSVDVRSSAIYSSITNRATINSVIIPELIGCDPTFFIAHRGIGTLLLGTTSAASENTVQIIPSTGEVKFFQDFTSFEEDLWFDYKKNINI